jgi:glucosamine kinase
MGGELVPAFLGLDIGGSRSRAWLESDGLLVAAAEAPSASLAAAGAEQAALALTALLGQLPLAATGPVAAVCAGAAGLSEPATRQFLTGQLAPLTATGIVRLTDDAALVLAAAGEAEGIAVISGTGSIAAGRWRDHRVRAGGWGYLLGDEGSGYWLVRAAVRTVLARRDEGGLGGPLAAGLLEATGAADVAALHAQFLRDPRPARWAACAPAVLASGDQVAGELVTAAARALAELATTVAGRLADKGAPAGLPVVLAGGLLADARLSDQVQAAVRAALPGRDVVRLAVPPVAGAVRLAEQAWLAAGPAG